MGRRQSAYFRSDDSKASHRYCRPLYSWQFSFLKAVYFIVDSGGTLASFPKAIISDWMTRRHPTGIRRWDLPRLFQASPLETESGPHFVSKGRFLSEGYFFQSFDQLQLIAVGRRQAVLPLASPVG